MMRSCDDSLAMMQGSLSAESCKQEVKSKQSETINVSLLVGLHLAQRAPGYKHRLIHKSHYVLRLRRCYSFDVTDSGVVEKSLTSNSQQFLADLKGRCQK